MGSARPCSMVVSMYGVLFVYSEYGTLGVAYDTLPLAT